MSYTNNMRNATPQNKLGPVPAPVRLGAVCPPGMVIKNGICVPRRPSPDAIPTRASRGYY